MSKQGTVNIHGNEYKTVALRVHELRQSHPDWSLTTKVLESDSEHVMMRATLMDSAGVTVSTGHAEEDRDKDETNRSAALEVCETSAIGRCLAFASWPGSEIEFDPNIASADEVASAIRKEVWRENGKYQELVFEHWDSIVAIKVFLSEPNLAAALEAWRELGRDATTALWRAPSKGGIFTTLERKQLDEAATADWSALQENGINPE